MKILFEGGSKQQRFTKVCAEKYQFGKKYFSDLYKNKEHQKFTKTLKLYIKYHQTDQHYYNFN